MKFGVSTACFYPRLTEDSLKLIGEAGVKTAEIFFNALSELKAGFIKQLCDMKDYYGMDIVAVHPTFSLAESFMLFSNYQRRYDEAIEWYKRYGEIAAILGAKYIVLHGGKPNTAIDDNMYFERFAHVSEATESSGGILLQENVVKHRAGNLQTVKNMINAIGDRANFCLDIKQCVRGGYTPLEALSVMGNRVKHIHISDHSRDKDCMLPLKGDFDFAGFYNRVSSLGIDCASVVEVYKDAYTDTKEVFSSLQNMTKTVKI